MFKKTIPFLSLLLITMLPTMAQRSLLYKISGNGLPQPSYVYGTIHMICPQDFQMPDKLAKVAKAAHTLYLEVDMDDPTLLLSMGMLMQDQTPGYSLEKAFRPEDFQKLKRFMKDSIQLDVENFLKMKPLVLHALFAARLLPCKQNQSVEQALMDIAKSLHKPIEGLETAADQIKAFDAIPDSLEAAQIMDHINDTQKQRAILGRLFTAYKSQDITALHDLMLETEDFDREAMLYGRNRRWIPLMEKAMKKEMVLFAVGAGHLGGGQGVLALLRKKGYKVEAVTR